MCKVRAKILSHAYFSHQPRLLLTLRWVDRAVSTMRLSFNSEIYASLLSRCCLKPSKGLKYAHSMWLLWWKWYARAYCVYMVQVPLISHLQKVDHSAFEPFNYCSVKLFSLTCFCILTDLRMTTVTFFSISTQLFCYCSACCYLHV